jgi:hypothetical protein
MINIKIYLLASTETGSIKWRKNKITSFGGLPKMVLMASE